MKTNSTSVDLPNGPAAAALLAGGIGAAFMGIITTLSEASPAVSSALNWYNPTGALTGKSILSVAVFLLSWVLLYFGMKDRNVNFSRISVLALILLAIGLLGTFPPVFEIFAGG